MTMVRKEVFLDPVQNEALQRKARELGLSEAEFVRQILERALEQQIQPKTSPKPLKAVLEDAVRLSKIHLCSSPLETLTLPASNPPQA